MSAIYGMRCPWTEDWRCHTNCMLFVKAVNADITRGSMLNGEGYCVLAIGAAHIANETHCGGNYLVRTVVYNDGARNISDPPEGFLCSNCGWGDFAEPSHLLTTAKFSGKEKGPNYCPNCGAQIE